MRAVLLATIAALVGIAPSAWAFDWAIRKVDGRDYVGSNQVAEFYGLPRGLAPQGNSLSLSQADSSLRLTKDNRQVQINGANYWLSFPTVELDGQYWISRLDLGETIEPALRPERVPDVNPFDTVILDPGHGGQDKGAASPYEYEKNFSLDIARRVRDELQKAGVNVFMTRNSDTFVELQDRAGLANARPSSIFVSLHFNASPNFSADGLEIYCITPRGAPSTEYDELLVRDMVQEFGNQNELQSFSLASAIYQALDGSSLGMLDRGVKRARFAVLRLTRMPAVLVEGGFLSNLGDARLVANTDWRNRYAHAIAEGVLEYRKLAEFKQRPRIAADYKKPNPANAVAAAPTPPPVRDPADISLRDLPAKGVN